LQDKAWNVTLNSIRNLAPKEGSTSMWSCVCTYAYRASSVKVSIPTMTIEITLTAMMHGDVTAVEVMNVAFSSSQTGYMQSYKIQSHFI